jgi:hypothetical protein
VLDSDSIEIRVRYRVKGDKIGFHRTEVAREFPFPEGLGEFVAEALAWNRRSLRYATRYVNEVLAYKDYRPGGVSARINLVRARSARAARLYYQEFVSLGRPLPLDIALRNYANYVRYSLHEGVVLAEQPAGLPSRRFWLASLPLGMGLYLRDKIALQRLR